MPPALCHGPCKCSMQVGAGSAHQSWFVVPAKCYFISTSASKSHLIQHTKSENGWERLSRHVADARAGSWTLEVRTVNLLDLPWQDIIESLTPLPTITGSSDAKARQTTRRSRERTIRLAQRCTRLPALAEFGRCFEIQRPRWRKWTMPCHDC